MVNIKKLLGELNLQDFYNNVTYSKQELIEMCSGHMLSRQEINEFIKEYDLENNEKFTKMMERDFNLKVRELGRNKFYIKQ